MARVEPVNTWATSFDEQIILKLIGLSGTHRIQVFRDDLNTPVYDEYRGGGDIRLGTAQDVLNDHAVHNLVVAVDGKVIGSVPAVWDRVEPGGTNVVSFSFTDENGRDMVVYGHVFDLERGVIKSFGAEGVSAVPGPHRYIEVYRAFDDGTKVYWLAPLNDFSPGERVEVKLGRTRKAYVRVTYRVDFDHRPSLAIIGDVVGAVEKAVTFLTYAGVKVFYGTKFRLARLVTSRLGIHLPIVRVDSRWENRVVYIDVYYEQDIGPLAAVLIGAAIGAAIGTAITYLIVEMRSSGSVVVNVDPGKIIGEREKTRREAINACKELAEQGAMDYSECLATTEKILSESQSKDERVLEITYDTAREASKQATNWKYLALVVGVGLIAALLVRR